MQIGEMNFQTRSSTHNTMPMHQSYILRAKSAIKILTPSKAWKYPEEYDTINSVNNTASGRRHKEGVPQSGMTGRLNKVESNTLSAFLI